VPADPPQNVTVEAASSKSLIVRWEPPPPESQNGIITGYKLRWRKKGDESEVVTTDGSRRLFAITGLKNGKEYQVTANTFHFNYLFCKTVQSLPYLTLYTLLHNQ
jgi:neogenin